MRILLHSWEYGPGTGGIGQYLYQVARGLGLRGHEVFVLAGRDNRNSEAGERAYGHVYREYDLAEVRSGAVASRALELASRHGADLIEGADHWGECARIISAPSRPPVVIKYHGCQVIRALTSAEVVYPWQRLTVALALLRIRRQLDAERVCVEKADAAMAPSRKIIDDLRGQNARIPSRVEIVPNMIAACPEYAGTDGEAEIPTLLYAGRLELRKGIQYLPDILRRVKTAFPGVVLELAGADRYARGLGSIQRWLARQFGELASSVRFLGPLGKDQMEAAYRRCWAFVFPTRWDNFPMAVLEAMAYGKPVVTTTHGGMPEMLEGTGAPIRDAATPAFAEAVAELLGSREQRRRIGEASRHRVQTSYTAEQIIPRHIAFLEGVL